MRRICTLLLCLLLPVMMTGCTASADQRTGEAQGYGGVLRVSVSMNGSDITAVNVTQHSETEGVGTRAIDVLPDLIVRSDSVDVDSVSGATVTSNAIKEAVSNAIGDESMMDGIVDMAQSAADSVTDAVGAVTRGALEGVGMAATGRVGPGTDDEGNQVYSFNVVFASGSFDNDGRIRSLKVDQLEVLSSEFSGFPQGEDGADSFMSEVSGWTTKRAKGDDYMLTSGSWRQQMDAYEQMMIGMTMDEVNDWFSTNFSEENGKPTTDSVSGATMSLRDEHGDILLAIQRAWEDAQRSQNTGDESTATPTEGTMMDTNTETDVTVTEPVAG